MIESHILHIYLCSCRYTCTHAYTANIYDCYSALFVSNLLGVSNLIFLIWSNLILVLSTFSPCLISLTFVVIYFSSYLIFSRNHLVLVFFFYLIFSWKLLSLVPLVWSSCLNFSILSNLSDLIFSFSPSELNSAPVNNSAVGKGDKTPSIKHNRWATVFVF